MENKVMLSFQSLFDMAREPLVNINVLQPSGGCYI